MVCHLSFSLFSLIGLTIVHSGHIPTTPVTSVLHQIKPLTAFRSWLLKAGSCLSDSFFPGQRLSRCTCKGESHPGPVHSDGTFVGRAAPEVDMFEARVWFGLCIDRTKDLTNPSHGRPSYRSGFPVSTMGCMCAISYDLRQSSRIPQPFNAGYIWLNTSSNEIIPNPSATVLNTYIGGGAAGCLWRDNHESRLL